MIALEVLTSGLHPRSCTVLPCMHCAKKVNGQSSSVRTSCLVCHAPRVYPVASSTLAFDKRILHAHPRECLVDGWPLWLWLHQYAAQAHVGVERCALHAGCPACSRTSSTAAFLFCFISPDSCGSEVTLELDKRVEILHRTGEEGA